jgi:ribosome biogenesis SPOUT family RNA methylase Rps3
MKHIIPKIIIEHCEPVLSRWLWIEYKHTSEIVGKENLSFTNVKNEKERNILNTIGTVYEKSIIEMHELHPKIIILDPKASETLTQQEATSSILVIGGILGSSPPKRRTWKLITSKIPNVKARNLGRIQLPIDISAFISLKIASGIPLQNIKIKRGINIKISKNHIIRLPFGYPIINNKIFISPELIKYLKHDIVKDEEYMLKTGKPKSIFD